MTTSLLPTPTRLSPSPRLRIDIHYRPDEENALARDVRRGLEASPRHLHPKYLYDQRGAQLFDEICDTPEYYPTRTEHALLDEISGALIAKLKPASIIELGSGACRKTQSLLTAAGQQGLHCTYVPVDVSDTMLKQAAEGLLAKYNWLSIEALVADYTRQLHCLPSADGPRLLVFLGSTIGNFETSEAVDFLSALRAEMKPEDRLLLGTDLVKDPSVLNAAYNDRQGLTAAFNLNLLERLNRELGADFSVQNFEHYSRFVEGPNQIEMRLRSLKDQTVHFEDRSWKIEFSSGQTILTEISRKFTRPSAEQLLGAAGLEVEAWHTPENDYFALSVSRAIEK